MNTDFKLYAIHAGRFYCSMPIKHAKTGDWIPAGGYRVRAQLYQNLKGTWVLHRLALLTASRYLDIPWFGTQRMGFGLLEHVRLVPELEITKFDGGTFGPAWTVILKPGHEIVESMKLDGKTLPCQKVWNCACGIGHTGEHISRSGLYINLVKELAEEQGVVRS